MKEQGIWSRFKSLICSIGWKLFMWGNETTEEEYWEEIYQQEKSWKEANHKPL